jgi:beta-N-acetylhexosaminidase
MEEETLIKQEENFGKNAAWVNAYRGLAAADQHHEVMVAIDSDTNKQIGWTLMTSPSCLITQSFAFIPLCPSGKKTGLIACVGVDKAARGGGVGLGLMVRAMENMRERGMDGVLIDVSPRTLRFQIRCFDIGF